MPLLAIVGSINEITNYTQTFFNSDTNQLKSGRIQIGPSTYEVTFEDGKIGVSRCFSFLNLFRTNHKDALKEGLKRWLSERNNAYMIESNSVSTMKNATVPRGTKEVFFYGMSLTRGSTMKSFKILMEKNIPQEKRRLGMTIDAYNLSIGVSNDALINNLPTVIQKINDGIIGDELKADDFDVLPDTRTEWKKFLKNHVSDLDVFKKFGNLISKCEKDSPNLKIEKGKEGSWLAMMKRHGVDATIKSFLLKNMEPKDREYIKKNDLVDIFVSVFKECAALAKSNDLTGMIYDHILSQNFPTHEPYGVRHRGDRIFRQCMTCAFFRKTSKLGLEFVRERNIPVIFQWSTHDGMSMMNKGGDKMLNDKWWKNVPIGTGSAGKYGTVTFSEMRHVARLEKRPGPKLRCIKTAGLEE